MEVPFFLPTTPECAASLTLPDDGALRSPAVVFTPAWKACRASALPERNMAGELALKGHAVLRYDPPGTGGSIGDPTRDIEGHIERSLVAARTVLAVTGVDQLTLVGNCQGALISLRAAARFEAIDRVVALSCHLRKTRLVGARERMAIGRRLAARLSDSSLVSARLLHGLTRLPRAYHERNVWVDGLINDIGVVSRRARLTFVYGELDYSYRDFLKLRDELPREVRDSIETVVVEGVTVGGYGMVRDRQLQDTVVGELFS